MGVVESAPWLDEREQRAWRSRQFMQMRLEGELARQLAIDSGLSYPDYLVLVALTDRPDGRMRQFELGRVLGWEKSRLSHQIARMADRGLVTKEKCESDRRGADVVISTPGRHAIAAAARALCLSAKTVWRQAHTIGREFSCRPGQTR